MRPSRLISARCSVVRVVPRPRVAVGFRINLHMKDLVNALDTSHEVGVPLPLTATVMEMFTALKADGHEREDHSGLVQHYEALAQTRLGS